MGPSRLNVGVRLEYTKPVSVDDMQFYLAHGAELHPYTQELFLDELLKLQRAGKLSFTPNTIFHLYTLHLEALDIPQKIAVNG